MLYRYVGWGDIGYIEGEAECSFKPSPIKAYRFESDGEVQFSLTGEASIGRYIRYVSETSYAEFIIEGEFSTSFKSRQRQDDEDIVTLISLLE